MRVLVYHSERPLGKAIQFAQSNYWNHVGVEIYGYVYEMLGNGIVKRTLAESIKDSTRVIASRVDVDDDKAFRIVEKWCEQKVQYFFRGLLKQLVYQFTQMFTGKPRWIGKNYIERRFVCSTMVAKLLNELKGDYEEWWTVAPEDFANDFMSYNWKSVK